MSDICYNCFDIEVEYYGDLCFFCEEDPNSFWEDRTSPVYSPVACGMTIRDLKVFKLYKPFRVIDDEEVNSRWYLSHLRAFEWMLDIGEPISWYKRPARFAKELYWSKVYSVQFTLDSWAWKWLDGRGHFDDWKDESGG